MTTIGEAIENMMNAGIAMRKAWELSTDPLSEPRGNSLKPAKLNSINDIKEKMGMGDIRYNQPKEAPITSEEIVEVTIVSTEIYRQARLAIIQDQLLTPESRTSILQAQAKQVAYGLDKYPEPLNANTWDTSETIDHILDESIDKLHYLVMLRIKLEQALVSGAYDDDIEVRNTTSRIVTISRMIDNNIEEMGYLVKLNVMLDKEVEVRIDADEYILPPSPCSDFNSDKSMIYADNTPYGFVDNGELRVFSDDELKELAGKRDE